MRTIKNEESKFSAANYVDLTAKKIKEAVRTITGTITITYRYGDICTEDINCVSFEYSHHLNGFLQINELNGHRLINMDAVRSVVFKKKVDESDEETIYKREPDTTINVYLEAGGVDTINPTHIIKKDDILYFYYEDGIRDRIHDNVIASIKTVKQDNSGTCNTEVLKTIYKNKEMG